MNNQKEEKERLYHNQYFQKLAECYIKKTRWEQNRIRNVLELAQPKKDELVLDLGCAIGVFTIETSKAGSFAIGLDYAENAIDFAKEFARQLNIKNIAFLVGDAEKIPLKDNSVDLIICADLVEHLSESSLRSALSESYRVLKKDGRLAIYTPSPTHIFEIMMKHNFILKKDHSHIGLRKIKDIILFVEKAGFKIVKAYHRPTHIIGFSCLEKLVMRIPFLGDLAKRRTCILAVK